MGAAPSSRDSLPLRLVHPPATSSRSRHRAVSRRSVRSRAPESEVPAERAAAGGGHRGAGGGRAQPKNVEVVDEERQSATVLLDEAVNALWGVSAAEADDAWVPDQDTGVFVPAEEAANGGAHNQQTRPAVLDQPCLSASSWRKA